MHEVPLETIEQQTLAYWLRANEYRFYKSPSETWTSSFKQRRKNTLEGVSKGFPDTVIILKNNTLCFIELKRQRKILKNGNMGASPSRILPEQEEWIEILNTCQYTNARICYGAEEAMEYIQQLEKEKLIF